jgi:hypothetical protein
MRNRTVATWPTSDSRHRDRCRGAPQVGDARLCMIQPHGTAEGLQLRPPRS